MCPGNNKGTIGQLHSNEECVSINEVLTRVGDKWSLQVISRLGEGTQRFTELRRSIDGAFELCESQRALPELRDDLEGPLVTYPSEHLIDAHALLGAVGLSYGSLVVPWAH